MGWAAAERAAAEQAPAAGLRSQHMHRELTGITHARVTMLDAHDVLGSGRMP